MITYEEYFKNVSVSIYNENEHIEDAARVTLSKCRMDIDLEYIQNSL